MYILICPGQICKHFDLSRPILCGTHHIQTRGGGTVPGKSFVKCSLYNLATVCSSKLQPVYVVCNICNSVNVGEGLCGETLGCLRTGSWSSCSR